MKRIFLSAIILTLLSACNKDWEFPDYKYSTVYFPYQAPVRTLVLGEDIYDNTLDNQRKFMIMAAMGGVYENKNDVQIDVSVDDALAANLKFNAANGDDVIAMPPSYYVLPKEAKMIIPSGKAMGGLEVQLTDAFFADPRSVKNTFVIPMRINGATNVDSVLSGASNLPTPDRRKASDWSVVPKDYVLFGVKYVNPFHGAYLRRGVDEVKGNNGNTEMDTTLVYRAAFVEKDEVVNLFTRSLSQDSIFLNAKSRGNVNLPFSLMLNFDNSSNCTVAAPASAAYIVTGNGSFVKKGDMWGNEKRDVLYLKYTVDFGTTTHHFSDTLVMRDRAVKFETFTPVVIQ